MQWLFVVRERSGQNTKASGLIHLPGLVRAELGRSLVPRPSNGPSNTLRRYVSALSVLMHFAVRLSLSLVCYGKLVAYGATTGKVRLAH